MNYFLFLFISFIAYAHHASDNFSVEIRLQGIADREKIKLEIQVKNLSGKPVNISKYRRQDFKWEKIKSLGNYIIEIQRYETNHYKLFPPSADIDPVIEPEEYISLGKGSTLTDTLYIDGLSFSGRTESKRGFPSGKYRIKTYFNPEMWGHDQTNSSNWIEFQIE